MIRTFAVLVVFGFVSGTAFPAPEPAPSPRPKKPVLYFPTTVGTKWVYRTPALNDEFTVVVTDVKEKGDAFIVTTSLLSEEGKPVHEKKVAVSERGVAGVDGDKVSFDAANLELKLPYKEGETWEHDGITCRVLKRERVKVPAGEFDAIPVEITYEVGHRTFRVVHWHAPGVGLIKRGDHKDGPGTVLKSFTPGKEEPTPAPKDKK
jgi:hypothetical protein